MARKTKLGPVGRRKAKKVFDEFGRGTLRSGSKHGPKVKNHRQAVAIALSEGRREQSGKRKGKRPRSRR
jgi:hypothetical protein